MLSIQLMRRLASSSRFQPSIPMAASFLLPIATTSEFEVKIGTWDVLCGQDKLYDLRLGNIKYQQIVGKMRKHFYARVSKTAQKKLVREIEDFVHGYGGRFLRMDASTGKFRVMTMAESRNKISRTLRENPSPLRSSKVYTTEVKELDILCGRGEYHAESVIVI